MREAAVIGSPIGHTRSPAIFSYLCRELGIHDFRYAAREIGPEALEGFLQEVRGASSYLGFNVTLPHKQAVCARVDELTDEARVVGAANVVCRRGGRLVGLNTDVVGIHATLDEQRGAGDHCLMWGAGGAARAVGYALGQRGSKLVSIIATGDRSGADRLASALSARFGATRFQPVEETTSLPPVSLCVNATPIGMHGVPDGRDGRAPAQVFARLREIDVTPDALAFDLVYSPAHTPFMALAQARRMRVVGGLAMLIDQAIATFEQWFAPLGASERSRLRLGLRAHLAPLVGGHDDGAVFLAGMMGAGKSTVGAALAARLGWRFVDVDRAIEARHGTSIGKLFAARGEATFRAIEKQTIAALAEDRRTVVSLGGGALIDPETRALLRRAGRLVYLSARVETLLARLAHEVEERPLLAGLDPAARRARLEGLLAARAPAYGEALVEFATDDRAPAEIVDRLARWLEGGLP
jgi:shikimate dehydrogenase